MADDDGPLYLSKEGFENQRKLVSLATEELFDNFHDLTIQICIRHRIPPRALFEMLLDAKEDYLLQVIPPMGKALREYGLLPAVAHEQDR